MKSDDTGENEDYGENGSVRKLHRSPGNLLGYGSAGALFITTTRLRRNRNEGLGQTPRLSEVKELCKCRQLLG